MISSVIASNNRAIGIMGFRITEMGGETWSDGDIHDGKNDPAAMHKGEPAGPCHALTEEQRGKLKSKLRHLAQLEGGAEQMDRNQNLRNLLWISAFCRVGIIDFDQNYGPETFIISYLDEKVIEDMVLQMFSHLEEKWLRGKGLQSLRDMPANSKHPNEDPSNTGLMPSSEAFAVVVVESELRIQLGV
ncbi:hypothetical protein INS49_015132 [Diaporthe citri]|uniref:uncharacterized protein n=1 Tax=Diaporthe citri TaxID=83186 RepID=UPI001C80C3A0|nr:uncharacterized protein INS49_015132 [Diaporthe citri]KAG6357254.1 hypothetical protein INS49_015132 [Diaporthe citri]